MAHEGAVDAIPGSPKEQRKKEKATFKTLNDRLETVLGNIRRDNIKLARTIKDHEAEVGSAKEVLDIANNEKERLAKEMDDILAKKASMMGNKVGSAHAKAALEAELMRLIPIDQWDRDPSQEDTGEKFIELATAIATKELQAMKATAGKSYKESMNTLMQNSIGEINGKTNATEAQVLKLQDELRQLEGELGKTVEKNKEAAKQVLPYESPEHEEEMQERIMVALDEKDKQLQLLIGFVHRNGTRVKYFLYF